MNVLIVDDSSTMRKIVRRTLGQAGINADNILEAGDGSEALSMVSNHSVDLILCDINMPNMNGLEFLDKLVNLEPAKSIPVVMITTEGCENVVETAKTKGAKGFIKKPFTSEQAEQIIRQVVG
jgi:two-component system chemotaxis response regulator CheY